jgi:hypothetical protein
LDIPWKYLLRLAIGSTLALLLVTLSRDSSVVLDRAHWIWNFHDLSFASAGTEVILYQGDVDSDWNFHYRGIKPHPLDHKGPVTLLFRLYTLAGAPEDVAAHYFELKRRWERHGVMVLGLQIDYDSPSSRLGEYREWLHEIGRELSGEPLSITALATYVFDAPESLLQVSTEVDYLAMQLYRGYAPHADYREVVNFLRMSGIRHRVGVTLSPEFPADEQLCGRHCLGVAVFLNQQGPSS